MILYEEDWAKIPNAFPNYETSNISYIRASALLRDMGIKNHKFMLALHNKALVGVDPHDPEISPAMMMAVVTESYENFWYFVREVVRVPGSSLESPLMYIANRANLCLHWLYMQHIFTILTQIRQTGKSFGVSIPHLWQMQLRTKKHKIIGLTKDMALRSSHLSLMKSLDEELPFYLRQRKESDAANTEVINISRFGNEMVMFVPAKSPKQADRVGRGHVAATAFIDEGPYVSNLQISMPAMLAATNRGRVNADFKEEPYCTVLTSTVGDLAEPEGEFYFKLTQNSAQFSESMFDSKNREDLINTIRKQCRDIETVSGKKVPIRVYAEFNHRQLGVTDEQVAEWVSESSAEGSDAEKDYFNKWKFGGTRSALSKEQRERIESSKGEPNYVHKDNSSGYMLRWYQPKEDIDFILNSEPTVWGLDTSDAIGGDGISLVGESTTTGQVIGTLTINETFIPTFISFMFRFLRDNPKTVLIPERRSTGGAIIDGLLVMMIEAGINPFRRIYNTVVNDSMAKPELFSLISKPHFNDPSVILSNKKCFGFATSASGITSRSSLYGGTMQDAIRVIGSMVYDPVLCNQLQALIIDDNGKVDHRAGMHDDAVIAWLLSYWFMTNAKNLDFYGLNYRTIFKQNDINKSDNDPEKLKQAMLSESIKGKISAYMEMYNTNTKDIFLRKRIEMELNRLYEALPVSQRAIAGFDEIMANMQEERRFDRIRKR